MLLKLFRVCLTPIFWRSKHPRVNDLLWAFKASYLRGVLGAILRRSVFAYWGWQSGHHKVKST